MANDNKDKQGQWEVQLDVGNSNLYYICDKEEGQPVVDYGFERQRTANAFVNHHNESLARHSAMREERNANDRS